MPIYHVDIAIANSVAFQFLLKEFNEALNFDHAESELPFGNLSHCVYAMEMIDLKQTVVGCAAWSIDQPKRTAWISFIAVDPEFRQKGIASKIISMVETEARKRGCVRLAMTISQKNKAMLKVAKSSNQDLAYVRTRKTL